MPPNRGKHLKIKVTLWFSLRGDNSESDFRKRDVGNDRAILLLDIESVRIHATTVVTCA